MYLNLPQQNPLKDFYASLFHEAVIFNLGVYRPFHFRVLLNNPLLVIFIPIFLYFFELCIQSKLSICLQGDKHFYLIAILQSKQRFPSYFSIHERKLYFMRSHVLLTLKCPLHLHVQKMIYFILSYLPRTFSYRFIRS